MLKNIITVLITVLIVSAAKANLISDGDFSSGILNSGASTISFSQENLNKWYSYSSNGNNFYQITDGGYISPATQQQAGRIFVQIIEAPQAGDYELSFDYRLSDDSDMFSVVRAFGINDDDGQFDVSLNSWVASFGNVTSTERLYDQGGYESFLPTAQRWANVSGLLTVDSQTDYIAICAAFSYDGTMDSMINDYADLDNFAITGIPEPATVAILTVGGLFMLRKRK